MILQYPSIAALRAECIALKAKKGYFGFSADSGGGWMRDWFGKETEAETLRKSETGDTTLVPLAQEVMDKLDSAIETPRKQWEPSMAGAYAIVPEVLAGHPLNMRRMRPIADEGNPITIVCITSSSASISAQDLTRRGVAVLALGMALARVRPIQLYVCDIGDGVDAARETIVTAKINTSPLDLATACYALTSTAFTRRLVYTICHNKNGSRGGWPPGYYDYGFTSYGRPRANTGHETYIKSMYGKLGLNPEHSLIIDAARLNDPTISDPIPWVNAQVARFLKLNEEAAGHV